MLIMMGIYKVQYKIEKYNPDIAKSSPVAHLLTDDAEVEEVHLDNKIENKIKIHRIGLLCISIIAGIEIPPLMNHVFLPQQARLPIITILPLMPLCVICWWKVFLWMINTLFIKPCLIANFPSRVKEKGIINILRYSRIK